MEEVVGMEEVVSMEELVMNEMVKEISLKDISKKLEEFALERDWEKYHSPRNLLLAMVSFCYKPNIISSFFNV